MLPGCPVLVQIPHTCPGFHSMMSAGCYSVKKQGDDYLQCYTAIQDLLDAEEV